MIEDVVIPQALFGDHYQEIITMMADYSPFPRGHSSAYSDTAKLRAARIHLEETVFFAHRAYAALQPKETVELCAGFGIPSITLGKLYGVRTLCIDSDAGKMEIGAAIAEKVGISLAQEKADLFMYLRKHAPELQGKTLIVTAAYCRDKKKGKPMGTGERDIVTFAKNHHLNLALLPYRSGEVLRTGYSSEKRRVAEYEELLMRAEYVTQRHSTGALFRGQGAPEWFFLDILTARYPLCSQGDERGVI